MLHSILSVSIAFTIAFIAMPRVLRIALEKNLFDVPDFRKLHQNPIPSLGGISIFSGFIIAGLLCSYSDPSSIVISQSQYMAAGLIVLFFTGVVDDVVEISATKKLLAQVIAACIFYYKVKLNVTSLHGLFGTFERFPDLVGVGFTFFTIIVITNAFNLIDGIDGLAGSLGIITCTFFGIYFISISQITEAVWAFSMVGALLAFLIYNHHPAKIFMGDAGSLTLGILNAYLAIRFIEFADDNKFIDQSVFQIKSSPVIAMAILSVPLLDTLRVFAIRIFNGRSPFSPDRNHVHHLLADRNISHNKITLYLALANIVIVIAAYFAQLYINSTALLIIMVTVCMLVIAWLYKKRKEYILLTQSGENSKNNLKASEPKIIKYIRKAMIEN
jgi:UDP-GlcNAc:undecaprenyl-phosphate/decaprenyl-phosphate GlcNAc-1-phosphate transferase